MTPMLLFLALAMSTATPAERDLAGNRLEAFAPAPESKPDTDTPLHCTEDGRWCAEVSRDVDLDEYALHVFADMPNGGRPLLTLALPKTGDETIALWPRIIRLAAPEDGVLIGVQHRFTTGYSGGGGSSTELNLLHVKPGAPDEAKTVLTAPIAGSLLIRACFGEADMRARRGACHDEYSFGGAFKLDPSTTSGPPRLVFETEATAYPAGVSRDADSTTRGRLRKRDLVHERDKTCSYRRVLALDPESGVYAPDAALPDCGAYTVP